MTSPRRLWTGNWRQESEDARNHAATAVAEPPETDDPRAASPPPPAEGGSAPRRADPPQGPRRRRLWLAFLVPLVAAAAIAYAIAQGGDDNATTTSRASTKALPTSTTPAPRPKGTDASAIYASAGPAVASIRTGTGSGTGFLVRDNRTLVTNAHVVDGSRTVKVRFGPTGQDLTGQVTGTDPSADLAVVKIVSGNPPSAAKPLELADSSRVKVGQTVVAIGNPFGLDRTVTEGIVSALGREIEAPNGFAIENALQTDAAINPGNSGGPLLDSAGRVVGVNSQIETGGSSSGNVGIGFAVPSNTVARITPRLAAGKTVEHAWLGVSTSGTSSREGNPAAAIEQVVPGGPAAGAGLRAGDVITAIDGRKITQFSDIAKAVDAKEPGDPLKVTVARGGESRDISVKLGTRPQQVP